MIRGQCFICGHKAKHGNSFICHHHARDLDQRGMAACFHKNHEGRRTLPKSAFHKGNAACKTCRQITNHAYVAGLPDDQIAATDPKSSPAYSDHRATIVALLLGRPL